MSILNLTSDGLFNVLISIYKVLCCYESLGINKIESLCSPGSISSEQVKQTLNTWVKLGLFVKNGSEISIAPSYKMTKEESVERVNKRLPCFLREIVFKEENNENFWDSEKSKSADFTKAIAWMLAQDVYSLPTGGRNEVEKIENKQIADDTKRMMQNDTRWNGLKHWSRSLGFGWEGKSFIIDPTVAIRESLPKVFGGNEKLSVSKFCKSLALVLPVIDSGNYRLMVENVLNDTFWHKPGDLQLSSSLSRAIQRLEVSGHIRLDSVSDEGEVYHFLGRGGNVFGDSFTHLIWCVKESE